MSDSNDKLESLLDGLCQKLNDICKENEHLTPTLNDIYDLMLVLGIKARNEQNSEKIFKELKKLNDEKDERKFMQNIFVKVIQPILKHKDKK